MAAFSFYIKRINVYLIKTSTCCKILLIEKIWGIINFLFCYFEFHE